MRQAHRVRIWKSIRACSRQQKQDLSCAFGSKASTTKSEYRELDVELVADGGVHACSSGGAVAELKRVLV